MKTVIVTKGKGLSGLVFLKLIIQAKDLILLLIGSEYPRALEAIWGNGGFGTGKCRQGSNSSG